MTSTERDPLIQQADTEQRPPTRRDALKRMAASGIVVAASPLILAGPCGIGEDGDGSSDGDYSSAYSSNGDYSSAYSSNGGYCSYSSLYSSGNWYSSTASSYGSLYYYSYRMYHSYGSYGSYYGSSC